ncbi:MAG TPA: tetratricopeptide repeat protein [Drouetiella sp.]
MREFEKKLFLTTALMSSISFIPVQADEPAQSAPVPGVTQATPALPNQAIKNDEDNGGTFPAESAEAIKTANELHAKAIDALRANKLEEGIALDEQARKAAPHYWLPHAALAYLYANYRGGGPAVEEAAMAVRCEHPVLADYTHATLFSHMHAFYSAQNEFTKLVASDPTSWRAKAGAAQCYIGADKKAEAIKLLDEVNNENFKDPVGMLVVGSVYSQLGMDDKAKDLLKRGLALSASEPVLKDKILLTLYGLAVKTSDRALLTELGPQVERKLDAHQRSWWRIGSIIITEKPADARLALQLDSTETVNDIEYREYAAIFAKRAADNEGERKEWLSLQKEALKKAFEYKETLENKLMLAAVEEELGERDAAVKLLRQPMAYSPTERDQDVYLAGYYKKMRKAEDEGLAALLATDPKGYKVRAHEVTFQIPMANCRCKTNSARSILIGMPGVLDVVVGPGDKPVATVFFDPKKTSKEVMFDNPKMKNFKEKFIIGEAKPVQDLAEIGRVYANQEHSPLAAPPNINTVALQYPTLDDAQVKVTADTKQAL